MIRDVRVKPLKVMTDDRGFLMEMLRADDPLFEGFGQVYVTGCRRGVAKAWHYHKIQSDYFCCIHGTARLVLYDPRGNSPTKGALMEFLLGPENLQLVSIPPEVYHGFQCVSGHEAIMMNIPTVPYNQSNPDEYRLDWQSKEVPYTWPDQAQGKDVQR